MATIKTQAKMKSITLSFTLLLTLLIGFSGASSSNADQPADLARPFSLSVDGTHFCSIDNNVRAYCSDWDQITAKQFQNTYPSHITTNSSNTCVLSIEGKVACLGKFSHLDNTPGEQIQVPTDISNIIKISASESNLCFISKTNDLACIGLLGLDPIALPSNFGKVQDVFTRGNFVCAINLTKDLKCLGNVYSPGLGNLVSVNLPSDLGKISKFSASNFGFCIVNTSGDLKCFGSIAHKYQNGKTTGYGFDDLNPTPNLGKVTSVSLDQYGGRNACAVTVAKAVKCWGYQRALGASFPDIPLASTGMSLSSLKNVIDVQTSWRVICVIVAQGKSFGSQCFGDLTTANASRSVAAPTNLFGAVQIPDQSKLPKLQVTPMVLCLDSNCYGYSSAAKNQLLGSFKTATYAPSKLTILGSKKAIVLNYTNVHASYCELLVNSKVVRQHFDATETPAAESKQGYTWVETISTKPGKYKVQVKCGVANPYLSSLLPNVNSFSVTVSK